MIKLGIVGSRDFIDYLSFKAAVLKVLEEWQIDLKDIEYIISGGAKGADTMAEKFAEEYDISTIIYSVTKNNYNLYGKGAPLKRNTDIVNASTHMIAFPSKKSRGTLDTISKTREKGIPIKILYID